MKEDFVVFLPVSPAKNHILISSPSLPVLSITYKFVGGRFFAPKSDAMWQLALSPPPTPPVGGAKTFFAPLARLWRAKGALIRSPFPASGKGAGGGLIKVT
jgi:hypothetical protein